MKTLRRGTKMHNDVLNSATGCVMYSEHNQYQGAQCEVQAAAWALHKFSFAKLVEEPGHKFVVRVHDRCWFELEHGEELCKAKKDPEGITMTLQQTRMAYSHYLKKDMPDNMTYYNALRELVRKVGIAELRNYLANACKRCAGLVTTAGEGNLRYTGCETCGAEHTASGELV